MNLALFDLDNTLLSGDSDFEWSQFLVEQGVLDRELFGRLWLFGERQRRFFWNHPGHGDNGESKRHFSRQ